MQSRTLSCRRQEWRPCSLFSNGCWVQYPVLGATRSLFLLPAFSLHTGHNLPSGTGAPGGLALLPFVPLFSFSQMTGCHPTLPTNSAPFPSGPRWAERTDWTSRSPRDTSEYGGQRSRILWLDLPPSHTYSLPGVLSLQGEKGSRGEKVSLQGLGPPLFGTGRLESHSS